MPLVRMQGQRKSRQPIPQFCLKPLGIGLVFKASDEAAHHRAHLPRLTALFSEKSVILNRCAVVL
jgi:hypothetical protein